jgi:hypothetical protein
MDPMIKEYSLNGSHAREFLEFFQTTLNLSQKQKIQAESVEVWNSEDRALTQFRIFDAAGNIIASATMDIV